MNPVAERLTGSGWAVYANDQRGHGRTAPSTDDLGHMADQDGWNKAVRDLHAINRTIAAEQPDAPRRVEQMLGVMLGFAARNPGIARVLTGEVLVGEDERLRARVSQYFERCETELRQILMHYEVESGRRLALAATP